MHYPEFFDRIPSITLYDPLSELLGSFKVGHLAFNYADCARIAGHSCPTVAGAYLMTRRALKLLYPDSLPVRGQIAVHLKTAADEGTTGVVATLVSAITGASDERGFKGLGGKFSRSGLLHFSAEQEAPVRVVRCDTGAAVSLWYDPAAVPPDPHMPELMQKLKAHTATPEERHLFGKLWQKRVEAILLSEENTELLRAELESA